MSERSSPTDFIVAMLGGIEDELAASVLTFRRPAMISYIRFWKQNQLLISLYKRNKFKRSMNQVQKAGRLSVKSHR